jgi:hypothetical protein
MGYTLSASLLLVLLGDCATAAILTAPTPTPTPAITAAPLKVRDVTTVGYISTGAYDGTTLCTLLTQPPPPLINIQ